MEARPPLSLVPSARALWTPALRLSDLGEGQTLCTVLATGRSQVLDEPEAALLRALQRPCEASALLDRLEDLGWDPEALDPVADLVKSLVDRGLVLPLGRLAQGFESGDEGEVGTSDGPWLLAIPSAGRPALLARCLESWRPWLQRGTLEGAEVLVVDDSGDPSDQEATRKVVEAWAAGGSTRATYLGLADRAALARRVAGGEAPETLYWVLGLDARGIMMVDDDTFADFRRHPTTRPGMELAPPTPRGSSTPRRTARLWKPWASR